MAINPELITTIRVDQLPDGTLNLTNKIPHTSGTVLEKASVQELVDLVATTIGVSGGVGYVAISVTDGQQLPDVPELPSFFLCGAGTFLNINGYPNIICTENLNAIMSLTDHWELAVEIPINPLSGTVQSVTGSAVDNTDPLNPVINEIIFGVQNIIAGTNITVDNTDPANPIVSATGGGGTPTLQEVLDNNHDLVDGNFFVGAGAGDINTGINVNALGGNAANNNTGENVNALGDSAGLVNSFNNVNLFGNSATADENGQTVLSKDGAIMARISTTNLTESHKYNLPDADGTLALTSDITTPTLQQVTAEGNETSNPIKVIDSGNASTQLQQNGIIFDDLDDLGSTFLSFQQNSEPIQQIVEIRPLGGTMALLSDIPTGGGGIPHATASGTDTYTATITGVTAYNDADAYLIRFTNGNTTSATLNINSLGAVPLYRNNDGPLLGGDVLANGEMLCIYNSTTNIFQVIGISPNSLIAYVTNDDSVTITKGMPVYAFSGQGDRMTVKRANNSSDATSAQTVGLVLSTSIAAGQKGVIMMQGLLDGLSTLPTATFADGDPIYVGSTDGSITNVKPYAPNHLVYLGVVTTASNGSAGRMYVRVQNGYELSEIHDIDLISNAPTNNQALTYESSTDLWKNKTIIEDSITNGVTDIGPSQNAVFDALALKQNILSYTPYRNIQTSQTARTGTTAETVLFTATIPAGAFNSVDVLKVLFGANKTTGLGAYTLRFRVNTTNTISGAPTIATYTGSATAQMNIMMRNYNLNGGNLYGLAGSASSLTDIVVSGSALGSTTLNPANEFFIFATVQLGNSGDTIIGNMFTIHN